MDEFKIPVLPTKSESLSKVTTTEQLHLQLPTVEEDPKKSTPTSTCPYKIPLWSGPPKSIEEYKFEILKSGQILEEVKDLQKQAVWTFGRLPENDIEMAHPTISRFHAVLQYRPQEKELLDNESSDDDVAVVNKPPEGWYIYDLGSTHGTFLNKQRIPERVYIRIRVGHILKLGASTRSFILYGPKDDEEPESDLSVTELREKRQREIEEAAIEAKRKIEEAEEKKRNEGISWGMSEDADEETDISHNPYASTNNEELFLDDPKKTLRGYFEREGLQLDYKCDEMSTGSFVCKVELPLDDTNGRPIVAEVIHKGRKKDCVLQCALEACRILDRHGVLRQANQEPLRRKLKCNSDSDEDEFWDRTGDVERKKQRKQHTEANVALTYDELMKKSLELKEQLEKVEKNIFDYHDLQKRLKHSKLQNSDNIDDLDSYMENLDDGTAQLDKTEIRKLRLEQQRINMELQKLERLIKIAKPTAFGVLKTPHNFEKKPLTQETTKQMPMIGKRNQFSKFRILKPSTTFIQQKSDAEEFDEDNVQTHVLKNVVADNKQKELEFSKCVEEASPTKELLLPTCTSQNMDQINTADNQSDVTNLKSEDSKESKKRRHRQRLRQPHRQVVDISELEEHESCEKYAKWVPPENQTGDGITALNEKFGY